MKFWSKEKDFGLPAPTFRGATLHGIFNLLICLMIERTSVFYDLSVDLCIPSLLYCHGWHCRVLIYFTCTFLITLTLSFTSIFNRINCMPLILLFFLFSIVQIRRFLISSCTVIWLANYLARLFFVKLLLLFEFPVPSHIKLLVVQRNCSLISLLVGASNVRTRCCQYEGPNRS